MTTFMMNAYKNGNRVEVAVHNNGKYRKPKEYEPLSHDRVVGIDTEARKYHKKLKTVTTQVHLIDKSELAVTADDEYAFVAVCDILFPRFAEHDKDSYTKQRARRTRKDGKHCRDGTRRTIPPVLGIFYNLEYDGPRLFGNHPQFMRVTTAELDNVRIQVGEYSVEIKSCMLKGGAPNFEFFIRRDGKIMRLIGHDMWGYWKGGLDRTAKQLLGPDRGKDEFAKENHDQTWEDFLLLTDHEKELFFKYSRVDAELTRDIYLATVDLLLLVADGEVVEKSVVIRRDGTIPVSAPSAAARIAFAMGPDEWDLPPAWVYKMGAETYAGARVFNRRRDFVEGQMVKDINSAYPHAMTLLPDLASCFYQMIKEQGFNIEKWKGQWGVMQVSGENYDPHYPCLRVHDLDGKRLKYVHGKFEKIWATIPEIVIGVVSGRLRIDLIHQGCWVRGSNENSFLRHFILKVHALKSKSEKDSPLYLMAKLLMNALYGKLVEIQVSQRWIFDDTAHFEPILNIPDLDTPFRRAQLETAYSNGQEGLDVLFDEWQQEYPDVKQSIPIGNVLKQKPAKAGQFYFPMHGAQITGFVSAKLGLAAKCTMALQGDTDSIFFDADNENGMEAYRDLMLAAGYDCPEKGLGSFETEVENGSGYLVKTKMYGLKYEKQITVEKYEKLVEENKKLAEKGLDEFEFTYHDGNWYLICYKCANHGMRGVKSRKEAYYLLETVMKDGSATYTKKQVRKWLTAYKTSIKTGEDVPPGEFYDQVVEIHAPNNPDQELDEYGEWVWKKMNKEEVKDGKLVLIENHTKPEKVKKVG